MWLVGIQITVLVVVSALITALMQQPPDLSSGLHGEAFRSCLADALWPATSWISRKKASLLPR
ncbi:MAG: hypothetical protein BRD28_02565 [Bacteroidetes bacterium QH_10_64_37]|nr:MAG: hypothetical protein BRD28_02565 [Bacteroidetes bacterium QH_10_64_37]